MKSSFKRILTIMLALFMVFTTVGLTTGSAKNKTVIATFKFLKDKVGWTSGFTDLPVDYDKDLYELEFKQSSFTADGKKRTGLFLKGHNRSDDLFMFITKKIDKSYGLRANATYNVNLTFDLATNVPAGMIGIGGSPGGSVFVKAGVLNIAPKVITNNDYYYLSIDKGNQQQSGRTVFTLGNIEKTKTEDSSYELKSFKKSFKLKTDKNGELWIIIGTDSGFEGLTKIYFTNITFKAVKV